MWVSVRGRGEGGTGPICGHILISNKFWLNKARMVFPIYIVCTLQSLLTFGMGDLLKLSKKCLFSATLIHNKP